MAETPAPPPSPSPGRLSTRARIALGAFCALTMLYSLLIAGQILLGVLVCAFVVTAAFAYRLVSAFYRLVAAAERIAAALESREGTGRSTGRDFLGGNRATRSENSSGREGDSTGDRSRDHVRDRW